LHISETKYQFHVVGILSARQRELLSSFVSREKVILLVTSIHRSVFFILIGPLVQNYTNKEFRA